MDLRSSSHEPPRFKPMDTPTKRARTALKSQPGWPAPASSASASSQSGGIKVDATVIAKPYREQLQERTAALKSEHNVTPLLVGFLATGEEAAKKYAEWTARACNADGISFELRECTHLELEDKLAEANADPKVHGIMIYYPCFGGRPSFHGGSMDDYLRDTVAVEKDVEGLSYTYRRNLYHNTRTLPDINGKPTDKKCVHPCTPLALVKILEAIGVYDEKLPVGDRMTGKTVTVVNRSEVVGRPLAAMLANDGAKVYSVDIDSIFVMQRGRMFPVDDDVTAESACRASDVIVTGVPSKDYQLPVEWVRPGTVVMNVSQYKNVDEQALLKVPGVVYVPMVGKVTVAMLERNLMRLVENFHMPGETVKVIEAGGRVVPRTQN